MNVMAALFLTVCASAQATRPPAGPPNRPDTETNEETNRGSIRGRVVLPSGNSVGGAVKITLQNFRETVAIIYTDQRGEFNLPDLHPGDYVVEVEPDGQSQYSTLTERVSVYKGMPSVLTLYLKEKKSAERPEGAEKTVSASELEGGVPAAARKQFERASKAAREGKTAEAIALLRKAIAIHPGYLLAHNDLGTYLMSLGKLDEAEEHFREAVRIDARSFNPQLNLGILLVQKHDFAEAAAALDKALSLDSGSPAAHLYAGLAALGLDNQARAEEEFKAASAAGGARFSLALFHLGQIYMGRGDRESALSTFEKYLREAPDAPNAEQVRRLIGVLRQP